MFHINPLCSVHNIVVIIQQSPLPTPGISLEEVEQLKSTITDMESQITDITDQLMAKEAVEKRLSER